MIVLMCFCWHQRKAHCEITTGLTWVWVLSNYRTAPYCMVVQCSTRVFGYSSTVKYWCTYGSICWYMYSVMYNLCTHTLLWLLLFPTSNRHPSLVLHFANCLHLDSSLFVTIVLWSLITTGRNVRPFQLTVSDESHATILLFIEYWWLRLCLITREA